MSHDVFVSHSSRDKSVADAVTAHLEQAGIRCWIAPRDIVPGDSWGGSIVRAIESCAVMVVIFSSESNTSQQVLREVERALSCGATIIPLRIDNTVPSDDLSYFLSATHWLDAMDGVLESKLGELVQSVSGVIARTKPKPAAGEAEEPVSANVDNEKSRPKGVKKRTPIYWVLLPLLLIAAVLFYWLKPAFIQSTELGVFESNWGQISFEPNNARARYTQDNGRLIGRFEKASRTFTGYWVEDKADRSCPSPKDGSFYWGRVQLSFVNDYSSFAGQWSYCDERLDGKRNWAGARQ